MIANQLFQHLRDSIPYYPLRVKLRFRLLVSGRLEEKRMSFFVVTMSHPDGDGWNRYLADHAAYLERLVGVGVLRASGPLVGTRLRSGFLIFTVSDRATVEALVAKDPFALAGLIETLTIIEWDPLFGAFAAESSGSLPGLASRPSAPGT